MGLFNNEAKEQKKQFAAQLSVQKDSNDASVIQQMNDQGQVAYDPQVSGLLLECNRRFLPWKPDFKNNTLVLPEKYAGLKEPYSIDDSRSFLNDEERKIVIDGYELLAEYLMIGEKYGFTPNLVRAWNQVVVTLEIFPHTSRMDGKSVKASKSQYVESNANVFRGQAEAPKQKFLGLF